MILETSLQVLDGAQVEDFTVKAVADALGTTSMAIYRYFPSRDDLLFEVADEVWRRYRPPAAGENWQETVRRWVWAIKRHADSYPIMMFVQGPDRRVSRGWARLNVPLVELLQEQVGLQGKALTVATYLFGSTVFSMMRVVAGNRARDSRYVLPRIEDVTADAREAAMLASTRLSSLSEHEAIDALISQYVVGIDSLRRTADAS